MPTYTVFYENSIGGKEVMGKFKSLEAARLFKKTMNAEHRRWSYIVCSDAPRVAIDPPRRPSDPIV